MKLSPSTLQRLETLSKSEKVYVPNSNAQAAIHNRYLIELIGPAAGGKSTIMGHAQAKDTDFSYVTGFTTRGPEPRDVPGRYYYYNTDEEVNTLIDHIEKGDVLQYVTHPTSGQLYGSFPSDYKTSYNMLDTLFNTVAELDRLPFKGVLKIAIVSRGNSWADLFLERYPKPSQERTKRINEAVLCLNWMINEAPDDMIWLENPWGTAELAADNLISLIKGSKKTEDLRPLAVEMLERAKGIAA
ncbi:MAG: hypothetical protein WAV04_02385 [Candidatus Microsaccharimonas sp.]